MPNHIHLLVYTRNYKQTIDKIIGNGKRFMAYEIVERLEKMGKNELLKKMSYGVNPSEKLRNKKQEVFEPSFDCKEILTEKFIRQKLNYMHKNPMTGKWKLVDEYPDYKNSNARFYDLGEKAVCTLYHYSEVESETASAESPRKNKT